MDKLPVIELTIDDIDLDRVEAIAFVDNPAIQVNWMAFNKEEQKSFEFATHDEEKRIVAGPLMIPDMNIYRKMEGKEFFVKFSAKTIEDIVNKFMKEGKINAFNYMHDDKQALKDVYVQQSFIINSEKGVNPPKGFEGLPDGTWFGYVKVDNDSIWNDFVKTGKLKGFSVEGNFSEKNKFNYESIMSKIKEMFEDFKKKHFNSAAEAANNAGGDAAVELGEAVLADGSTKIKWEGQLGEGVPVTLEDGSPAPDGEHTLQDGTVIAVSQGVVAAVKMPEQEQEMSKEVMSKIQALETENANLKKQLEGYVPQAEFNKVVAEFKAHNKEMFELVEAIAKNATEEKVPNKAAFRQSEFTVDTKLQSMAAKMKLKK